MNNEIVSKITKTYLQNLLRLGKRMDRRGVTDYREIEITKNIINNSEGSAKASIGNTTVVVGVKMEPGTPYPDIPDCGVLTTNAELIPMASPSFEPGPPTEDSIELARVVDRGIRESGAIDFNKLCIVPNEKVWVLYVDIHVVDYDGNLFDTAFIGCMSALLHTTVPAQRFGLGDDYRLPIDHFPVSCTAVKIGNVVLIDPRLDEENSADARLTITTDENGNICAIQKALSGGFTPDEVLYVAQMSYKIGEKVRELILK